MLYYHILQQRSLNDLWIVTMINRDDNECKLSDLISYRICAKDLPLAFVRENKSLRSRVWSCIIITSNQIPTYYYHYYYYYYSKHTYFGRNSMAFKTYPNKHRYIILYNCKYLMDDCVVRDLVGSMRGSPSGSCPLG